jgi:hypothetical protein
MKKPFVHVPLSKFIILSARQYNALMEKLSNLSSDGARSNHLDALRDEMRVLLQTKGLPSADQWQNYVAKLTQFLAERERQNPTVSIPNTAVGSARSEPVGSARSEPEVKAEAQAAELSPIPHHPPTSTHAPSNHPLTSTPLTVKREPWGESVLNETQYQAPPEPRIEPGASHTTPIPDPPSTPVSSKKKRDLNSLKRKLDRGPQLRSQGSSAHPSQWISLLSPETKRAAKGHLIPTPPTHF